MICILTKSLKKVWSNSFAALTKLIESCNYDMSEHGYAKIAQFGNVKLRKCICIASIDSVRMAAMNTVAALS